ncbi:hypothetical protein [Chengkuizengella axinellae]|uniref:Uncharacterized protein n=1 Tax=Chengkuizengella axinellae TaxID=3064388 RepID=A0ABT9J6J7_9BACL|nr:hypothetical protein [Chengkuizengella sp. 2205SS18-9]MDP5277209.1 hypothetical protein [Chengkuizengella sp. 2205SS18-9]
MDKFSRLFDLNRYLEDVEVCFSINGDVEQNAYFLSESICSRIICIGNAYKLHYLPLIDIYGDIKLNKTQVFSLIEELLFIKSIINDEVIEYFVPSIIKLLEEITHSKDEKFLLILGN